MKRHTLVFFVLLTALALLAACVPAPTPVPAAAGIPNPASVNCIKQGGVLDIRKEAKGEVGYCKFADGSECEEWAYFRGECAPGGKKPGADMPNPASKYCVDQGGKLEIRDEAGGQAGYCVFPDGSECDEWAYFRGECAPGGKKPGVDMPNPASKYCADQGGKLDIRDEAGGQAGYCLFPDGSECDEWAYFRGECVPGDKKSGN